MNDFAALRALAGEPRIRSRSASRPPGSSGPYLGFCPAFALSAATAPESSNGHNGDCTARRSAGPGIFTDFRRPARLVSAGERAGVTLARARSGKGGSRSGKVLRERWAAGFVRWSILWSIQVTHGYRGRQLRIECTTADVTGTSLVRYQAAARIAATATMATRATARTRYRTRASM